MTRQTIVLASHDAHKLEELRRIVGPLIPGVELIGYEGPEPVETGTSFEENALLKARAAAVHTGLPAITRTIPASRWTSSAAAPGSSRPAGAARRGATLPTLSCSSGSSAISRTSIVPRASSARRHSWCPKPRGVRDAAEICELGVWQGSVLRAQAGEGGFGYDPIFQPEGSCRSAAELAPAEKDRESHRTRAFTALAAEINARYPAAE